MSEDHITVGPDRREDAAVARLVRRVVAQWPLIVLCAVAASAAGYFVSSSRPKEYRSSSKIQLQQTDLVSLFLSDQIQISDSDPTRRAATTSELVTLPRVLDRASRSLGGRVTADELAGKVKVETSTNTDIVTVSAFDGDPGLAAQISNAMVAGFIASRRDATREELTDAKTKVQTQYNALSKADKASQTGQVLQDRLRQVGVVGALANGGVDIVQAAQVPKSPMSPKPKRDAIFALIAGLLLGLLVAMLRARLDERIRDADELAELWDVPVVGLIPEARDLAAAGRGLPDGPSLEAFALARTNLRYLHVGGDVRSVVVTSALESEGKSTVAWNLAVAAALAESKVLLIEGDLRRPVLAERLRLASSRGMSELLAGMAEIDDVVSAVSVDDDHRGVEAHVNVIPAGMVPPSPIALLERDRTGKLLAELRERYDLVIIDTPPATVVADALVMLEYADGAVIVSRLGRVTRKAISRLREQVAAGDKPVLGQIVNGGASQRAYGYTSYYMPAAKPAGVPVEAQGARRR